jgi:DNA-binding SARP family transcriptional activator
MSVPQRVRLFGVVGVEEDGTTRPLEMSNKTIALLGYMVRQRAAIARGPLAALLWGDTSDYRSRRNLTRALGQIAAEFPGSLRADQQRVQWVASDQVWVDLQDCDMLLRSLDGRGAAAQNLGAAGQMERAVALYRGEFLADLTLDDCPEFETWLVRERERWRQQIAGAASTLISHHTMHGSIHSAERYARFWFDLEPGRRRRTARCCCCSATAVGAARRWLSMMPAPAPSMSS